MNIRRRYRGVTLVELIVTSAITGLVFVVISSILIASMRIWRRNSSQAKAYPSANTVIYRINQELHRCCEVLEPSGQESSNRLVFVLPLTRKDAGYDTDVNINALDANGNLIRGKEITYYLSDDTGDEEVTGSQLWRKELDLTTDEVSIHSLTDAVSSLTFTNIGSLSDEQATGQTFGINSTAITIEGKEGATVTNGTFNTEIAIRNPTPP